MRKGIFWFLFVFLICIPTFNGYAQTFHKFNLGSHHVEGTTLEFMFPDEKINTLYAFNFANWDTLNSKTNQAIIRLYDGKKNLLDEGKSVCINTNTGKNFGSVAFSKTNRTNVRNVVYFTLMASPCTEGTNTLRLKDHPDLKPLFEYASVIAKTLLQCMGTGKSEQVCICTNKDKLNDPIIKANLFLDKHPELKDKEILLFESESSYPEGGSERMSLSMPIDELTKFRNDLMECK